MGDRDHEIAGDASCHRHAHAVGCGRSRTDCSGRTRRRPAPGEPPLAGATFLDHARPERLGDPLAELEATGEEARLREIVLEVALEDARRGIALLTILREGPLHDLLELV